MYGNSHYESSIGDIRATSSFEYRSMDFDDPSGPEVGDSTGAVIVVDVPDTVDPMDEFEEVEEDLSTARAFVSRGERVEGDLALAGCLASTGSAVMLELLFLFLEAFKCSTSTLRFWVLVTSTDCLRGDGGFGGSSGMLGPTLNIEKRDAGGAEVGTGGIAIEGAGGIA